MAIDPVLKTLIKEMVNLVEKHQAEILKQREEIKQLKRDVEFLLAADASSKTRFAKLDDSQRRLEAEKMYGIRK